MMRFNLFRNFILTCCALSLSGLLFVACGASPNLEKTETTPSFDEEFSSAIVDGEEFTVLPGDLSTTVHIRYMSMLTT